MRISAVFTPTLREAPAEAETASHRLLMRAGMIRRSGSGFFHYLPLAGRTLDKLALLLHEELGGQGGQEVILPLLMAIDDGQGFVDLDEEVFRLRDRSGRRYRFGAYTEAFIELFKSDLRSYRQLPLFVYQFTKQFRDEAKPRYGLLRGRESATCELCWAEREGDLAASYEKLREAIDRALGRIGLMAVQAEAGAGGCQAHSFLIESAVGESELCQCAACGYAATGDRAELAAILAASEPAKELNLVCTPNCKTMEEVAEFLGFEPDHAIKTLAYSSDKGPVLALVRGDHEVNETKVKNALHCRYLMMADEETLGQIGSTGGYIGPIGIKNAQVIADHTVMKMVNTECGGNLLDHHYVNVKPGRDFVPHAVADIRKMKQGDPCPQCGAPVGVRPAIEVGRIAAVDAAAATKAGLQYIDADGAEKPVQLAEGSVNLSRILAAIAELYHDDSGLAWPAAAAPFQILIVPVNTKDAAQRELAATLERELELVGYDVLLDDREERAGIKFTDADLIGYPLRLTIGPKSLAQNAVECKVRRSGEVKLIPMANYMEEIKVMLQPCSACGANKED